MTFQRGQHNIRRPLLSKPPSGTLRKLPPLKRTGEYLPETPKVEGPSPEHAAAWSAWWDAVQEQRSRGVLGLERGAT